MMIGSASELLLYPYLRKTIGGDKKLESEFRKRMTRDVQDFKKEDEGSPNYGFQCQ